MAVYVARQNGRADLVLQGLEGVEEQIQLGGSFFHQVLDAPVIQREDPTMHRRASRSCRSAEQWSLSIGLAIVVAGCSNRGTDDGGGGGDAGGQDWATSLCEAAAECECEVADVDACVEAARDRFDEAEMEAMALGLTFDAACMASWTEANAAPMCGGSDCQVYYGDGARADDCTWIQTDVRMSTCAQGLACIFDTCWDYGAFAKPPVGLGEVCDDGSPVAPCEDGLLCGLAGVCVTPVSEGESCDLLDDIWCDTTTYCNADSVCVPRLSPGAPCELTDFCVSGYLCREGTCQEPPSYVCGAVG